MSDAIVVIGGYNSVWPAYLKLARILEDVSQLPTVAVPLLPWHWWTATRDRDATRILRRLNETVGWARRRLGADKLILVGHSAGGLVARLYLSDEPIWGNVYAGLDFVTSVVTLGSPHCASRKPAPDQGQANNWFLVDKANQHVPGAAFRDRVGYLTVAGRFVQSRADGTPNERRAYRYYKIMDGQAQGVWGDGIVPLRCAQLEGATVLVLHGVSHSPKFGRPWYGGSKRIVQRWWHTEAPSAG